MSCAVDSETSQGAVDDFVLAVTAPLVAKLKQQ